MTRTPSDGVRLALRAALDLVLPGVCAACGEAGAPLCTGCGREVRMAFGRAPPVATVPVTCWSAVPLDGALRTAVSVYKDGDRRDLAPVLATALAAAVGRSVREDAELRRVRAAGGRVLVVPVPPAGRARRRRGDDPVGALVRAALRRLDDDALVLADVLHHTRRVADQAHLGREARAVNLEGAFAVLPGAGRAVARSPCLVVDDVLTTGATLAAAASALVDAGAAHVVAATLARTARDLTAPTLVGHRAGG